MSYDISGWYDKEGNLLPDSHAACEMRYDRASGKISDYARIGEDQVGEVRVSTVWLGLNHAFGRNSPPLIFESLVFGGEHDQDMMRYATEQEAIEGHRTAVENLRAGKAPWPDEEDD